ncbi:MAG: hypothetical protein Q9188_006645 [Gyalolechia gomerana]
MRFADSKILQVVDTPRPWVQSVLSTYAAVDLAFGSRSSAPKDLTAKRAARAIVISPDLSWDHDSSCTGMDFKDIPVEDLTHLYFSFAYVTPGDFYVAAMDNAPSSLFSDFTELKKKNSGLEAVVALGGWTFNENGATSQPVFIDMVRSASNRAEFISYLLSILREYALMA